MSHYIRFAPLVCDGIQQGKPSLFGLVVALDAERLSGLLFLDASQRLEVINRAKTSRKLSHALPTLCVWRVLLF